MYELSCFKPVWMNTVAENMKDIWFFLFEYFNFDEITFLLL